MQGSVTRDMAAATSEPRWKSTREVQLKGCMASISHQAAKWQLECSGAQVFSEVLRRDWQQSMPPSGTLAASANRGSAVSSA